MMGREMVKREKYRKRSLSEAGEGRLRMAFIIRSCLYDAWIHAGTTEF